VAGAEILGKPDRAGDIDAGRAAKAEAFVFQQVLGFAKGGNPEAVKAS
jgi:hypothetical protein